MSATRMQTRILRPLMPCILLLASLCPAEENDIFAYHREFHFLLERGQQLFEIPQTVDALTPTLHLEVEIFAAADLRASAELLYTSTSMLLQQHATLVDVFTETRYFKASLIRPTIELLLNNNDKVRQKCERYLSVVRRPELFQQILNLKEITQSIEANLGKFRTPATPANPAATSLPKPTPPPAVDADPQESR